jgi:lipopolysaccharide/colanic/teichoic acid biosynthesis glycosyltransferase
MRILSFLNPSKIYNLQRPSKKLRRVSAWLNNAVKRALDISVSFLALLAFTPFLGLIALAIKRDSPGPVLYRGDRTGRGGKPFKIFKFRTMYESPESYSGPKVTAQDDPRITPLGRWLRDTKFNELPQLWNVLKGEMSLVGPRPEDPSITQTWPTEVWKEVLSVRPGITSPASVQYRHEESLLSARSVMPKYLEELIPDKIRLDQLYVRNRSLLLDLDTLFWTALIFLPRVGSHAIPEELLFVGPIYRLMRRHLRWFTIDGAITFFSIGFIGVIFRLYAPLDVGWPRAILLALGFALLFSISAALMGVNRIAWSDANYADALELIPPWVIAASLALALNATLRAFPWELIAIAALLSLTGFILVRYRSRLLTGAIGQLVRHWGQAEASRERVLIIGTGTAAQLAAWLFDHSLNAGKFWIVGFVDNDIYKQGMRMFGAQVIGKTKQIPELVRQRDVGVIVITDQTIPTEDYRAIVRLQEAARVKLVILPDMMDALLGFADSPGADPNATSEHGAKVFVPCRHCLARHAVHQMKLNQ